MLIARPVSQMSANDSDVCKLINVLFFPSNFFIFHW